MLQRLNLSYNLDLPIIFVVLLNLLAVQDSRILGSSSISKQLLKGALVLKVGNLTATFFPVGFESFDSGGTLIFTNNAVDR